jgi:hypothetical protein
MGVMFSFALLTAWTPLIALDRMKAPGWVLVGCFLLTMAVCVGSAELDRRLDLWTPLAYLRWMTKLVRRRRTGSTVPI